jgi:hypothetical protein
MGTIAHEHQARVTSSVGFAKTSGRDRVLLMPTQARIRIQQPLSLFIFYWLRTNSPMRTPLSGNEVGQIRSVRNERRGQIPELHDVKHLRHCRWQACGITTIMLFDLPVELKKYKIAFSILESHIWPHPTVHWFSPLSLSLIKSRPFWSSISDHWPIYIMLASSGKLHLLLLSGISSEGPWSSLPVVRNSL